MEAARIIACCALAVASGLSGLGALDSDAPGIKAVMHRFVRTGAHLVKDMGRLRVASILLEAEPVAALCDELVKWAARQGVQASKEDACGALVACVASSTLLCALLTRSIVGPIVALVAWCIGVPFWDAARRQRRSQQLTAEMPDVFRTLAMAMASGETLTQAVQYVGENGGGLSSAAFRSAALKLRCGIATSEALDELVQDLDAPGIDLLATALLISQRTGSPLRSLFQHSAALVERQGEFERMLSVKTAQVRLSVRIVSLLPPVMVGTLSLISPDFQRGLMTVPGMGSLVVAATMDLCALWIIRHLMKGVL